MLGTKLDFDSAALLRKPTKSAHVEDMWKLGYCRTTCIEAEENVSYIIDGGSLLQKLPWSKDDSFEAICIL